MHTKQRSSASAFAITGTLYSFDQTHHFLFLEPVLYKHTYQGLSVIKIEIILDLGALLGPLSITLFQRKRKQQ